MLISIDTETTGLDFHHGQARPFFVTTCSSDSEGQEPEQKWWEWDVDPLTRLPIIPSGDRNQIKDLILSADTLILHNAKFDIKALTTVLPGLMDWWPWDKTVDTIMAAHILASNNPKDLTTLAATWLGIDILPYELRMKEATQTARRLAKTQHPDWVLAQPDSKLNPSMEGNCWAFDTWLPKAMASSIYPAWKTITAEYANVDSLITLGLWRRMEAEIELRKLMKLYRAQLPLIRVAVEMEAVGVAINLDRIDDLLERYAHEVKQLGRTCVNIAKSYGHELVLPKSGNNKSLLTFVFDVMKLPPVAVSKKTGVPSLDAKCIMAYQSTLRPQSKPGKFFTALRDKRKRDVAISYMESYHRFAIGKGANARLHPSINLTGTDTLRFSSQNPNEQNISKKEGFNLRYGFGPAPGREWYSCDAQNIELRLPAYDSGEQAMIDLFEHPNEPPYYGSNHLLIAHVLFPQEFEACVGEDGQIDGRIFKKKYAATWYQKVKNGNFAVQYGALDRDDGMGTADRAYGLKGAHSRIRARFIKQELLNQRWVKQANITGQVETMIDYSIDPTKGYPLLCGRTAFGKIRPTTPLNYRVQGTAGAWMRKAMIRCAEQLREWNSALDKPTYFMIMTVHDELVFDFPRSKVHPKIAKTSNNRFEQLRSNWWRIDHLRNIMASGGDDYKVPTTVSIEYHPDNWSAGETI